jgi:HEAT repeat protein
MRSPSLWPSILLGVILVRPITVSASEIEPIQEWQIRGILAALQDGYPEVRRSAMHELSSFFRSQDRVWNGSSRELAKEAVPDLFRILTDSLGGSQGPYVAADTVDSDDRVEAALLLAQLGSKEVIPTLRQWLGVKGRYLGAAALAVGALGQQGVKEAVEELRKLLKLRNYFVCIDAARALGPIGATETLPDLLALLNDSDLASPRDNDDMDLNGVKISSIQFFALRIPVAAHALDQLGSRGRASEELEKLLHHRSTEVRLAAAVVLGEWQNKAAIPVLMDAISHTVDDLEPVISAMARSADQATHPRLVELIRTARWKGAREAAAKVLGRMQAVDTIPQLSRLLEEEKANPDVRNQVILALGLLNARTTIPDLRALLKLTHPGDENLVPTVIATLGRLEATEAIPDLRALLKPTHPGDENLVPMVIATLGRLRAREAIPDLLNVMEHGYHKEVADVLPGVGAPEECLTRLRELLDHGRREVREFAASVLGAIADHSVGPKLTTMLDQDDAVAEPLGRLRYTPAVPKLRDRLKRGGLRDRASVIWALGELRAADAVPDLIDFAARGDDRDQAAAVAALKKLHPFSVLEFLRYPYEEDRFHLIRARWLACYFGGGCDESRTLCAYLGRPASDPAGPPNRGEALPILEVLGKAWDECDSRWLQEDVASWVAWIITERVKDWKAEDVPMLRENLLRLSKNKASNRTRAYAAGVERVIAPFEIKPTPWERTLLAILAVNLVAALIHLSGSRRDGRENWLPFVSYAGAGVAAWLTSVILPLHLIPWVMGVLLVGELVLLVWVGVVFPAVLAQLALIAPLNRVAIPLALSLSWSRRRVFRDYVAEVHSRLDRDKRLLANEERYLGIPVEGRSRDSAGVIQAIEYADPAEVVLQFLTRRADQAGRVLIEALSGRGKSTLLREVAQRALNQFETAPTRTPLPVLVSGKGESVEQILENVLPGHLVPPQYRTRLLRAGGFVLMFDAVTELGPSDEVMKRLLESASGRSTPVLLTGRPSSKAYRYLIEGTTRWMVIEPRGLNEELLPKFLSHYGGADLVQPLKDACRGQDGYVPILLRMAMTIKGPINGSVGVASIYRSYLSGLSSQASLLNETDRRGLLERAAHWCLETYWIDGVRRRHYESEDELQRQLLDANVLVFVDNSRPPNEVRFFHDSVQSFLTAYGLAIQDGKGYEGMPGRASRRWGRGDVLLRAVADPRFGGIPLGDLTTSSDIAEIARAGGTDLFRMCLETFPRESLRVWLRDELQRWASVHGMNLRRMDVEPAIPTGLEGRINGASSAAVILEKIAREGFEADTRRDTVEMLGSLYAGVARSVYVIEHANGGRDGSGEDEEPIDRRALVSFLATLGPPDLSLLVAALGASKYVSRNATVPEQVAELVRWAESDVGPGLEGLHRTARQVLPPPG